MAHTHVARDRRNDNPQPPRRRRDDDDKAGDAPGDGQERGGGRAHYLQDVRSAASQMRRPSAAASLSWRCIVAAAFQGHSEWRCLYEERAERRSERQTRALPVLLKRHRHGMHDINGKKGCLRTAGRTSQRSVTAGHPEGGERSPAPLAVTLIARLTRAATAGKAARTRRGGGKGVEGPISGGMREGRPGLIRRLSGTGITRSDGRATRRRCVAPPRR